MGSQVISIVLRFAFLVLFQGLILNNIDLFGFVNPYLYVLLILLLPVEMNSSVVLIVAFFLGLSVDLFALTWGMHTTATVFLAFLRPTILRILAPRDSYPVGITPSMSYMGISWFLIYAFLMILVHHLFLFYVEVFRFEEFFSTMGRAFASVCLTYVLVLLSEFLTFRQIRAL